MLFVMLISATFMTSAQSINPTGKVSPPEQDATQKAPAEKFFNIQSLDDLKITVEATRVNYQQATADKSEALHIDYLKAKRLYIVELEKQKPYFDKTTETGQKIRSEMQAANATE